MFLTIVGTKATFRPDFFCLRTQLRISSFAVNTSNSSCPAAASGCDIVWWSTQASSRKRARKPSNTKAKQAGAGECTRSVAIYCDMSSVLQAPRLDWHEGLLNNMHTRTAC